METLGQAERADRARAGTDEWDALEVPADLFRVGGGRQRSQPRAVQRDPRAKEASRAAKENNPGVDRLLALYPWDDSNDGVVIRGERVHSWPPRQRRAATATC